MASCRADTIGSIYSTKHTIPSATLHLVQMDAYKQVKNEHAIMDNYNDNVLGASTTKTGAIQAKEELGSKFEIKDMGELNYILEVCFNCNPATGDIAITTIIP